MSMGNCPICKSRDTYVCSGGHSACHSCEAHWSKESNKVWYHTPEWLPLKNTLEEANRKILNALNNINIQMSREKKLVEEAV